MRLSLNIFFLFLFTSGGVLDQSHCKLLIIHLTHAVNGIYKTVYALTLETFYIRGSVPPALKFNLYLY